MVNTSLALLTNNTCQATQVPGKWYQVPGTLNKSYTSGASYKWFSKGVFCLSVCLPEDPLCLAGQPSVTADESKMAFPLVDVPCGYSLEVHPLPVAHSLILLLHCGHLQQQLVLALRFQLSILAKLCFEYLFPQSTAWVERKEKKVYCQMNEWY